MVGEIKSESKKYDVDEMSPLRDYIFSWGGGLNYKENHCSH